MRTRYAIVSIAVPVAVGAIIAAYGIRQHTGQQRTTVASSATSLIGNRPGRHGDPVVLMPSALFSGARIQTEAQASSRALEVAQQYGATQPRVVNVEMLGLEEAITRTQRDSDDELDLGAAGYGESTRALPTWRVQLEHAAFGTEVASAAMLSTAILVLAAAGGTLIDMTLGYPVPQ